MTSSRSWVKVRASVLVVLLAASGAAAQVDDEAALPPNEDAAQVQERAPAAEAEQVEAAEDAPLLDLDDLAAADAGAALPVAFRARPLHGLPAGMAALMMGGREGGQVALAPLAMPVLMPGATSKGAVALLLEIDGRSLLGADPPLEPEVQVYAYALNPRNEVVGFLAQSFVLDLAQIGEAVFLGGLKFTGHLELPAGDYTVRLLVHEPSSQRFGLSLVEVTVPQRAALLTPLVAEAPEAPWLSVGEAPHGDLGALDLGRALALAGLPMPSALPLLRGDETQLDLLVYGAAGAALPDPLTVRVEDIEGRAAGELEARLLSREATGLPGIERLRIALPLSSLESGSYRFRAAVPSLGGAEALSAALPAVVLRGASTADLWTDIQRRISGDTTQASIDFEEVAQRRRGRQRRVREAVADAYRQVLRRLADSDLDGALAGLVQVEREVLDSGQEAPLDLLREAEAMIVDAVAASQPQGLLPVANLHGLAYEHYRENLDFGLSTYARETSIAIAERFAAAVQERSSRGGRRGSNQEAETALALAADALGTFGAYLQTAQVRTTGQALLRRALELDPDNRAALIHLATGLEKTGAYQEAIGVLERLVAADPKSPEGRLRLAVNQRRLGQGAAAARLLNDLVREDNPPWVLAVAYQEQASMLLDAGRAGDAVALLDSAVGRLPGHGRLLIQLAYALDRAGSPARSREVMARLSTDAADDGGEGSPRHRYNRWPEVDMMRPDSPLQQAGRLRMPALGGALAAMPATGELTDWTARQRRGGQ